jgi:hypothetical protein
MNCTFKVGDRVVCVDDTLYDVHVPGVLFSGDLNGLTKGTVYTIRSVYFDPAFRLPTIRVSEIERLPLSCFEGFIYESGYNPERFRPVVSRPTSIAVFKAMLTPSKQKELAR